MHSEKQLYALEVVKLFFIVIFIFIYSPDLQEIVAHGTTVKRLQLLSKNVKKFAVRLKYFFWFF